MPILQLSDGAVARWPDQLNAAPILVVYKHSPFCSTSLFSRQSIRAFAATHPDIPVFQVDVVRQRALSDRIARDLGIEHESPQAIVVAGGNRVWAFSHGELSVLPLERAVAKAEAAIREARRMAN